MARRLVAPYAGLALVVFAGVFGCAWGATKSTDEKVQAALIAAAATLVGAVVSLVVAHYNAERAKMLQQAHWDHDDTRAREERDYRDGRTKDERDYLEDRDARIQADQLLREESAR